MININLILLKKLQRRCIYLLYKPNGIMYDKIKFEFDLLVKDSNSQLTGTHG